MKGPVSNPRLSSLPKQRSSSGVVFRVLGEGRPLVLVHGGSGSWLHWWRNIEPLAREHRVIAVDLPGYGESDDVPDDISLDDYVARVVVAVREAAPAAESCDVVAFSFGGLIGAGIAMQLGRAVHRTILFAPSGFRRPAGRELGRRPRSLFPEGTEGDIDFFRHNLLAMMLASPDSIDDDAIAIQRWNLAHARFQNLNGRFSFSNRLPEFLARLRCPLLLAYGERDRTPYPSREERVAICREAAPHLVLEVVPEAGHWLQFERPTQTNALIEHFLAGERRDPLAPPTSLATNHEL